MPNSEMEKLKRLPLRPDEVWQGAMVQMPVWTRDGERPPPGGVSLSGLR